MKEELCRVLCDGLRVAEVPMGLVVSTAFRKANGDVIGFYVSKPNEAGLYRIEDDGLTVPDLEASGFDLANPERHSELVKMLSECRAHLNENNMTLEINNVAQNELPSMCLNMVQLLIRAQDLYMITRDRVASTFEKEAVAAIYEAIGSKANVQTKAIVDEKLKDFVADVVIRAKGRDPVAVFMTRTDQRLLEAVLLQSIAQYEVRVPCSVIAMLEKPSSISRANWNRATNRLTAITVFSERQTAVERIAREAIGGVALHH